MNLEGIKVAIFHLPEFSYRDLTPKISILATSWPTSLLIPKERFMAC